MINALPSLPEKQNQGVAGLCQVEIKVPALLLINAGLYSLSL